LVVNPEWRKLDSQIRSTNGQRHRWLAQFGEFTLSGHPTESAVRDFEQRKGQLQEQIQLSGKEIERDRKRSKRSNNNGKTRPTTWQ